MENKIFIKDELCEGVVIGTLLHNSNSLIEVRDILNEYCFYNEVNRKIYKAILRISDRGDIPDIISVLPELTRDGVEIEPDKLCEISDKYSFSIKEHALRLLDLSNRRKITTMGMYMQQQGTSEMSDLADIITKVGDLTTSIQGGAVNHIRAAGDYLDEVNQRINDNIKGIKPKSTITGFSEIDKRGGLQPSNLIVVAADSSQGKTAFAGSVVLNAAKGGSGIAFYSLEMTGSQMLTRLVSMDSGISCGTLFNHPLTAGEQQVFNLSAKRIRSLNVFFDDRSSSSIDVIISSIRSMVIKKHIDGAVIDYLQILSINSKTHNVEEQLAEIARRLKNLAKELNIWILLLSQLSRDTQNPEPTISRLRGSGQVNEAADTTILIYRPDYYTQTYGKKYRYSRQYANVNTVATALVNVAKGRNTGTYSFICGFNAITTQFYELTAIPRLETPKQAEDNMPF